MKSGDQPRGPPNSGGEHGRLCCHKNAAVFQLQLYMLSNDAVSAIVTCDNAKDIFKFLFVTTDFNAQ